MPSELYPDTILFATGSFFALLTLVFAVYLLVFRKRSRVYAEVLRQETEIFDALTATATLTNNKPSAGYTDTEELNPQAETSGDGFDSSAIAASYSIEREIGEGAMSRTFIVKNNKLGNQWFLKFVSNKHGRLASEENILKLLNHAGLPKIADVFYKEEGTYLIETLVEGVSLDKLSETNLKLSQYVLLEWFEQIAQALNYLHSMNPAPVFHLDLKPGNIMVTHDNRLVLVDFGIARRLGEDTAGAVTAKYAAPEQFGSRVPPRLAAVLNERFGRLPAGFESWDIGAKTDIYCLGVVMFELATGQSPTQKNLKILQNYVPRELCDVIHKCMAVNPASRYHSVVELQNDLRNVKGTKIKMARTLFMRRLAAIAAVFGFVFSGAAFAGGYYVFGVENAATISSQPDIIIVSLQQSGEFSVQRQMPDGRAFLLDAAQISWEVSDDDIARIDGNRVSGLNLGQTSFTGLHRNGDVSLDVRVVQPMDDLIEISQRYETGRRVVLYAGTANRERIDGEIINFFSPESITATPEGNLLISDAGVIRKLSNGSATTIPIPLTFVNSDILRQYSGEAYILTAPWQEAGGRYFYALAHVGDSHIEKLFTGDAQHTAVEDFTVSITGRLYFIERNAGLGAVFLRSFSIYDAGDVNTHYRLPQGSTSIAVSAGGSVYIGNTAEGIIQVYENGELRNFAGLKGERAFIDGASPRFYMPQRLEYNGGYLYIWDFNTLRRIPAAGSVAGVAITIAGTANPYYNLELAAVSYAAEDIILPHGRLMDFTVTESGIFLTDHKRGVVWRIDYDRNV